MFNSEGTEHAVGWDVDQTAAKDHDKYVVWALSSDEPAACNKFYVSQLRWSDLILVYCYIFYLLLRVYYTCNFYSTDLRNSGEEILMYPSAGTH